jgi:ATP-dependent Clp protease ATP-binding subunit ClpA
MFDRFTAASRGALVEAQDLALELGSGHISPGHLLYGCAEIRDETGSVRLREQGITGDFIRRLMPRTEESRAEQIDPKALRGIGIDYEQMRAAVEQTFGPGALESAPDRRNSSRRTRKPPFTPDAKHTIELTVRVATELHHKRISPGHLVLGLLRLDDEFVATVLKEAGVTVAELSSAVLSSFSEAASVCATGLRRHRRLPLDTA